MPKPILQQKLWKGKRVYCLKSVILLKIENFKQDYIESKKSYCVKRSDAMLYDEGSKPNKKAKIRAEDSEDKMKSCSESSIISEV